MTHHARGTFTVKMLPLTPAPAEGISRFSIDKEIHGDLKQLRRRNVFRRRSEACVAGYVAIEVVTGTLGGRQGSFALQHSGQWTRVGGSCP